MTTESKTYYSLIAFRAFRWTRTTPRTRRTPRVSSTKMFQKPQKKRLGVQKDDFRKKNITPTARMGVGNCRQTMSMSYESSHFSMTPRKEEWKGGVEGNFNFRGVAQCAQHADLSAATLLMIDHLLTKSINRAQDVKAQTVALAQCLADSVILILRLNTLKTLGNPKNSIFIWKASCFSFI